MAALSSVLCLHAPSVEGTDAVTHLVLGSRGMSLFRIKVVSHHQHLSVWLLSMDRAREWHCGTWLAPLLSREQLFLFFDLHVLYSGLKCVKYFCFWLLRHLCRKYNARTFCEVTVIKIYLIKNN